MDIENIQITIRSNSQTAVVGIDNMVSALERLKTSATGGVRGLTTTANHLKKFSEALRSMSVDTAKFSALKDALNGLGSIEKASGFSSTINTLKKLPDIIKQLDTVSLDKFAEQMERVAAAVRPLAAEMQKVSDGFKAFPIRIKKIIESNTGLAASNQKTGSSFKGLLSNLLNVAVIQRASHFVGSLVKKSSEYTETLNLFTVAMGRYAQEAMEYAEKVSAVMGVDPSEWMRGQGVFMTLATGFGIAGDKAAYMSKNLTQLGYDISSYYNISVEDAMQKLQSGISGELEPLRRLGYDLSQAKLEAMALSLGIDKSVSSMTQAEKGMLRYQAIMTQVTQVQGDMARTLQSPANQLRMLQAAANQTGRALGNIFTVALGRLIPYAIAFLNVIRSVLNAIAGLFGFGKTGIGSAVSDASTGADNIKNSLGGGASSAKKIRDYLMGIDELNVIPDQSSGGGGGGGGSIADMFDFDPAGYDDFLGESSPIVKKIEEALISAVKWTEPLIENILWLGMSMWDFVEGVSEIVSQSSAIDAFKDGLTEVRDVTGKLTEYVSDIWRSPLVQALVGNALAGGLSTAGTLLAVVADAISVIVDLLRGDVGGVLSGVINLILDIGFAGVKAAMWIENAVSNAVLTISHGISNWLGNIFDSLGLESWAKSLRDTAKRAQQEMEQNNYEYEVNLKLVDDTAAALKSEIQNWLDPISLSADNAASGLSQFREEFSLIPEAVSESEGLAESVSQSLTDASSAAQEVATQMGTDIAMAYGTSLNEQMSLQSASIMSETASKLTDNAHILNNAMANAGADGAFEFGSTYAKELMSGVESALASTADSAANTFRRYVSNMVSELSALKNEFSDIVTSARTMASNVNTEFSKVSTSARNMASNVNSAIASITPSKSINVTVSHNASAAVSEINSQLKKIGDGVSRTVKITVMGSGGVIQAFADGGIIKMASGGVIPAAANGLSVDRGQLFIAREAGPELVAGIGGGRTAVMNNDQIVESVSNGVYRAVVDAMAGQTTDSGDIVLMLGDREVYRASKRGEKASGYSMVGNPSFA